MWKDFFYYTRAEQRGLVILFILIFLILMVRFSMPYWVKYVVFGNADQDLVLKIEAINDHLNDTNESKQRDSLFKFDPNKVTKEELIKLGFSKYQLKSFLAYRNKISKFSSKMQLLKVYGVDSALFVKIENYIEIKKESKVYKDVVSDVGSNKPLQWINFNKQNDQFWKRHISSDSIRVATVQLLKDGYITKGLPLYKIKEYSDLQLLRWLKKYHQLHSSKNRVQQKLMIELNMADTVQLKLIKGIGEKLSVRILDFRNKLGGFYTISQIKDVYGISDELFEKIMGNIYVDTTLVKKIDLDIYTVKEISIHPYFNYKQGRDLKNLYRKKKVVNPQDALKLKSIDEKDWGKMKHYLLR